MILSSRIVTIRPLRCLITLTILLIGLLSPPSLSAQESGGYQPQSGMGAEEAGLNGSNSTVLPDLFTGTLSASIPIEVPPGRNGMQPDLKLTYRSSNGYGWVGYGWELEVGSIERSTRFGVNNNGDDFVYRMAGARVDVVYVGMDSTGRVYRAKIEGAFTRLRQLIATDGQPYWEATDKTGKRYVFGQTAASRQDDPPGDPTNTNYRIFKWCLDRVEEPNGNVMTVSYTKDHGQVYLDRIDYPPANYVKFYLDNRGINRPILYTTNFGVRTSYRLQTIDVVAIDAAAIEHRVRAYQLVYSGSARPEGARLNSVQQFGGNATLDTNGAITGGSRLPAKSFTYTSATNDFTPPNNPWMGTTGPSGATYSSNNQYVGDFDGDGKTDWMYLNTGGAAPGWYVATSTGSSFNDPQWWLVTTAADGAPTYHANYQYVGDFNGDGKTDWMYLDTTGSVPGWYVATSNGHGFNGPQRWLRDTGPGGNTYNRNTYNLPNQFIGDFNGDGKMDWMYLGTDGWYVGISNGNRFDVSSSPWLATINGPNGPPYNTYYQYVGDFNGDGMADLLYARGGWYVALSTGTGFQIPTPWLPGAQAQSLFLADFNGDGKMDWIFMSDQAVWLVSISTGHSFTTPTPWQGSILAGPTYFADVNGDGKADWINVRFNNGGGYLGLIVALSTGENFSTQTQWLDRNGPSGPTYGPAYGDGYLGDFNGDGKLDWLYLNTGGSAPSWYVATGHPLTDLLTTLSNGLGGNTTIAYTPSTQYQNPQLPFPVQTVSATTTCDNYDSSATPPCKGVSSLTTYTYSGGYYHIAERDFRGFQYAKVTGPAEPNGEKTITETWFHQGNGTSVGADDPGCDSAAPCVGFMKSKPYRGWGSDGQHRIISEVTTSYAADLDPAAPYFNPPLQVDTVTCNGISTTNCAPAKQTRTIYNSYDPYGNVTQETHYGERFGNPTDPTDARTVAHTFTTYEPTWMVGLPLTETIYTGVGTTTPSASTNLYYDGVTVCTAVSNNTNPTKGNLTRAERWYTQGPYPANRQAYDPYGNVNCRWDANQNSTAINYDSRSTFPTVEIHDDGHTTHSHQTITSYYGVDNPLTSSDPGLYGQVKSVTDADNKITTTKYDAFGRKIQMLFPDGGQTVTQYVDIGIPGSQRIVTCQAEQAAISISTTATTAAQACSTLNQANVFWSEQYLDGLGRTYLTRTEGLAGQVIRQETVYDARSQVQQRSRPYFEGTTASVTTYVYDPLNRVIRTTVPDGTVETKSYSGWTVTTVDGNGHQKAETYDAFHQLVKVEEYLNSPATPSATTIYQYDGLGNLIKVKDAQDHLTTMRYDSLSRKIGMADPDLGNCGDLTVLAPPNSTFPWYNPPCWSYDYDANGNLTKQQDSRGQITYFQYDPLNRAMQKDFTTQKPLGSGDVMYTYDSSPTTNTIGRLVSAQDASSNTSYQYDAMGRVVQQTKTITGDPNAAQYGQGYTTLTTYDVLGRISQLTYPKPTAQTTAPLVRYFYNPAGWLDQITDGTLPYATYPAAQYTPLGQPTRIQYGNVAQSHVETTYAYRADNNRLQQITTKHYNGSTPGSTPQDTYQDLTYTFDAVGNITRIADGVHGDRTFAYDALNRLTQATYLNTDSTTPTSFTYGYDAVGNLTTKSQGATSRTEEPPSPTLTYVNALAPPVTVENTSPALSYEQRIVNWTTTNQSQASGGSYAYSNTLGNTASFVFTGTTVQWVSAKSKDSGAASIYLDGVWQQDVNLNCASCGNLGNNSALYQQAVWSITNLANTTHLVELIVAQSCGNCNVAVDAFVVGTSRTEESAPAVTLTAHADTTWTTKTDPAASGGSFATTNDTNALVTYRFTGTGVQWLAVTSSEGKQVDVYLDGIYRTTVDLCPNGGGCGGSSGSGSAHYQQVVWTQTGLAAGLHLLKLVVTPGQSGGGNICGSCTGGFTLDALDVLPTATGSWVRAENTSLTIDYGVIKLNQTGWSTVTDATASGGSYQLGTSSSSGTEATYAFSGYGIAWKARTDNLAGKAEVWLDGALQATVDLYSPTPVYPQQPVWSRTDLSNSAHTLTLVVTGTKNAASGGTNVYLDALAVYNAQGWHTVSDPSASGGQTYATDQAGATSTVTFTGTGISWLAPVGPTGGTATVAVYTGPTQEGTTQTVSLNNPLARAQQIVYTKSGLSNTTHTLVITTTSSGTTNSPIAGLIDAFDVTGALTTNVPCTYTNPDHVHAVSGCSPESYDYDAAGNLTARRIGSTVIQSYAWDAQNRLTASTIGSTTTTFTYDAEGKRVKKIIGTTPFIYIDKLYECTTSASCSRYVFSGEQRLSLIDSANAIFYYHSDHLGSSTVVTKGSGTATELGSKVQELTYEPYGKMRTKVGSVDVHHKFTGKELDDSTGLYHYDARYYDPVLARFISPDAVEPDRSNPQSLNRYSYVLNNPLRYKDPTGKYEIDFHQFLMGYLAYYAGFSVTVARSIGLANQWVDQDPTTNPVGVRNLLNAQMREQYHAFIPNGGSMADVDARRQELLGAAIVGAVQGNEQPIGIYFHFAMDKPVHAGLGYESSIGHLLTGYAPDQPFQHPKISFKTAHDVFDTLTMLRGLTGGTPQAKFEDLPLVKELIGNQSTDALERAKTFSQDPVMRQMFSEALGSRGEDTPPLEFSDPSQFYTPGALFDPVGSNSVNVFEDPEF